MDSDGSGGGLSVGGCRLSVANAEEHETGADDDRGSEGAQGEVERGDSVGEVLGENGLAGGIGVVSR